ncbi:hypothetical protein [uncultured Nocardioides sp.]|uniref:hypothetical protein n=1 Tax=uncultured Nocardioides sp. TaxID=198441 RepID=UPI0025FAA0F5|nr:hypothetical protein [uncultured Nocardioides sp.]
MTSVRVQRDTLTVSFTTGEKVAGLLRDQHIPLSSVRGVEVVPDGLAAVRGLRAPGLGLPGRRKLGTWRSRTGKALVAVHGHGPALRVTLTGHRYASLLITTDAPKELAASLSGHTR